VSESPILQVRAVGKSFGGVTALSDVTFDLRPGETLGVIGPNGSGKTTLTNCITGFVKKDRGEVIYRGRNISRLPAHRIADLGLLRTFQVMRPYYSLPAYKNLIVPLFSRRARRCGEGGYGDRDAVAMNLLEDVGFERGSRVGHKLASALPTGYLKRIELARCLALRPEILITDEVFSGLTAGEVASTVPVIERLQMQGMTLIMIEHRLRELFRLADRILVLNFGEKIMEGRPEEVMESDAVRTAYLGPTETPWH
jgi:ABC-type branched-subunit amino acid transport system ATPase component